LGETERAAEYFRRAADQLGTERWPDTWTYQALALERLGYADEARQKLEAVLNAAEIQLARTRDEVDFFAKFGSRSSEATLRSRALSMLGFAQQALGRTEEARTSLGRAVELDVSQLWAQYYLISLP
jgi:tetratricopeptide (TPR) repeat protein